MKSIIPMLAITVLAALVLAGCNQNGSGGSTGTRSTNDGGMANVVTNSPATNNMPDINTNMPAGTNQ